VDTPSADTFEPHVGTHFRVGKGFLTLETVARLTPSPGAPREQPFSLEFVLAQGSGGSLEQQIHVLRHDVLGDVELFLVPIGPDRYEALFN
jgi:hypothetical protein